MTDRAITVIVPSYNHEATIALAIESIVRQTVFAQCYVIVSDDCSSDATYDTARRFCRYYSNISVQRTSKNLGVMEHYQSLVSEIGTPFTAILEGDDMWIGTRYPKGTATL